MNLLNVFLVPFYAVTGLGAGILAVLLAFYLLDTCTKIFDLIEKKLKQKKPEQKKNLTPRAGGVAK